MWIQMRRLAFARILGCSFMITAGRQSALGPDADRWFDRIMRTCGKFCLIPFFSRNRKQGHHLRLRMGEKYRRS